MKKTLFPNWVKIVIVVLSLILEFTFSTIPVLTISLFLIIAFCQNVAFSIVSRSRNRDNIDYHIISAIFSNGIWFLTFRLLVLNDMNIALFIPYCIGTVAGSVWGVKISMKIETFLGATSDSHIKKEIK
jgi:predicted neutral ceramidase superfamily lipid hydrolase